MDVSTGPAAAGGIKARDFLAGGGDMARLIHAKDWSQTPLGPIEAWPQSLRTAASLCLASNFPINLIWGPDHIQIYNDGYRVVCGDAHPSALGQDYSVTWASAWPAIGQPFARALEGATSFIENQRMFLTRNGYLEETFFTFSLSPIRDESGGIGGLFHPVTETTAIMLAERRTRALRDLTSNLSTAADRAAWTAKTIETLGGFALDLPFVLFYELAADGRHYRLAGQHGIAPGTGLSPTVLAMDAAAPWPVAEAVRAPRIIETGGLPAWLQGVACGPYPEPPATAFVLPVGASGRDAPPALVIAGASPRLPLNDADRGFYELLIAAISAAFGNVQAREDERRRAEALAAIDRAKTVFFSNVSHELRTPLTLILAPVEDALAEVQPAAQRERLDLVRRNAQRLLKLVNALLDFSRIEAGRMQAVFEPVDLAMLTVDLASNFRSACARAGLDFRVECPPLSRSVAVDRGMWETIVLNLLSNAFKFTLAGRIDVVLRETATGVELAVRDSGVGIPAQDLPRIFERFHRVEGQRGRTHEGTGMGLSLVQELVVLHGGAITAESVEGEGTVLKVTLPFGASHLPPEPLRYAPSPADSARPGASAVVEEALRWLPEPAIDAPETAPPPGAEPKDRPRVILADDNADMRQYIWQILERAGYAVEAVGSGVEALAAARRQPVPDLVLCDVMMHGLDGFGLLKALRADPELDGLLVIMLSARAGEEARVEGLAAGAHDYLVKPFNARELRARIDSAVGLARQRRESSRAVTLELERRVAERTAELRVLNEKLKAAVSQRDLLLREVYHRVKNNMQVIDGLLLMQAQRLEDLPARQALLGLRSRVYTLGLVHHQLMGSADLRTFDVEPFLRELTQNILNGSGTGHVTLSVDASRLAVGLDFAIPLGMLINELVTNSLKHAFPQGGGRISVTLKAEADGNVLLVVSDNGHSQCKANTASNTGMGTRIIQGLVAQIAATIAVRHGNGTTTEIRTRLPAFR